MEATMTVSACEHTYAKHIPRLREDLVNFCANFIDVFDGDAHRWFELDDILVGAITTQQNTLISQPESKNYLGLGVVYPKQ